jgi:glycine betaine/choline ABC-type transport system substrate-binding protein
MRFQSQSDELDFGETPNKLLSHKSGRFERSQNKTGGAVAMPALRSDDIDRTLYIGRDAVTVIEGEWRQFEQHFEAIHRSVENIITGTFMPVQQDINVEVIQDTQ